MEIDQRANVKRLSGNFFQILLYQTFSPKSRQQVTAIDQILDFSYGYFFFHIQ